MADIRELLTQGIIHVWRDSSAGYVDNGRQLTIAAPGLARLDHNPDPSHADENGAAPFRGLLLEPAFVNRLSWSVNLMAPCWFDAHLVRRVEESNTPGPDGKYGEVISLTDLPGNNFHHVGQWFPANGGDVLTASIFVKPTLEGSADFSIWAHGGHNLATFRRSDFSPIAGIAEWTRVEKFRDGWFRVSATYPALDHVYFGCGLGAVGAYGGL